MSTTLNATIEYDEVEALDAREYGDWQAELAAKDLTTYDTGGERQIGWLFAADGSRIEEPCFDETQPATAN